ncbi:MAG: hypothetical protein QW387_06225, partial [Desulfurococcus sp.]|uniref:hypothetical protein n=1 Tax=Desulfurococcus sp. TaxID=51678 RepID=UPI0031698204
MVPISINASTQSDYLVLHSSTDGSRVEVLFMQPSDLLPALNGEGSLLGGSLVWCCIPGLS